MKFLILTKNVVFFFQDLSEEQVPAFVAELDTTTQNDKTDIANSSSTISAIVEIINNVAIVSTAITEPTVIQVG